MKARFAVAVIVLCLVCLPVFAQSEMKVVVGNVQISLPQYWILENSQTQTVFNMYSPIEENDDFQENCNLTVEQLPSAFTVDQYYTEAVKMLQNYYTDFKVLTRKSNYHIYSGVLNGTPLTQMQYFYIKGKTAYVLTFSSSSVGFPRYEAAFQGIAKTLSIR